MFVLGTTFNKQNCICTFPEVELLHIVLKLKKRKKKKETRKILEEVNASRPIHKQHSWFNTKGTPLQVRFKNVRCAWGGQHISKV